MNKEIKHHWITALRSGKYKQGYGFLWSQEDNTDRFCCLGVLCDLVDASKWKQGCSSGIYRYIDNEMHLPPSVRECVGLASFDDIDRLISMNDNGKSFEEIADYIEKNL